MSEAQNLALARQALAALNAHDIDGYLKNLDDSFVHESETLGTLHGHAGARQMLTTMFQAFPDLHFEVEQLMATGDHVISQSLLTGTHKGTFAGIAATNRTVTWRACTVVEVRNGKAIRSRIYADNVSVLRQLGVLPAAQSTAAG